MVTRLGVCPRSYRIADLKRLAYGTCELHLTTAVLSQKETTGWPSVLAEPWPGLELRLRPFGSQDRACLFGAESPARGLGRQGPGEPLLPPGLVRLPAHVPVGLSSYLLPHPHVPRSRARPCSSPGLRLPRWSLRPREPCTRRPRRAVHPLPLARGIFSPGKEPRLNLRLGRALQGRGQAAPTRPLDAVPLPLRRGFYCSRSLAPNLPCTLTSCFLAERKQRFLAWPGSRAGLPPHPSL